MILFTNNDIVQYVKEKYHYVKFKQALKNLEKSTPKIEESWDPSFGEIFLSLFHDDWD